MNHIGKEQTGPAGSTANDGVITPPQNLDDNTPSLSGGQEPGINRKALFFLAGMVLLLVATAVIVFRGLTSGEKAPRQAREERVNIPELPDPEDPRETALPGQVDNRDAQVITPAIPLDEDVPAIPLPPLPPPEPAMQPMPGMFGPATAQPISPPTLVERRMQLASPGSEAQREGPQLDPYTRALVEGGLAQLGNKPAQATQPDARDTAVAVARTIGNPGALLVRGTYLRCVLETRIITDVPGFTACVLTEPVYSFNGHSKLLPAGSRILGRYEQEPNGPRVGVTWDRILTPDGIDVTMSSPGVDNLGGAGHPGDYNAHWGSRMGAAMLVSLISDAFGYAAAEHGPTTTSISNGVITQQPFESATARTMERLANQALSRAANRPATVTIQQGTVVNVYAAKDIDFSSVMTQD